MGNGASKKKKVEMDAKKNALGAEDIAMGVFISVGSIKAEPKIAEIPTWFYGRKDIKKTRVMPGHALVFYRDYLIDPIRSLKLIILLPLLS